MDRSNRQSNFLNSLPKSNLSPITDRFSSSANSSSPNTPLASSLNSTLFTSEYSLNESKRDVQELRRQISELLRYKDQVASLKNQLSLVEERGKSREEEFNNKISVTLIII